MWHISSDSPPAEAHLKTTRDLEEQVLRKRPYLRREWIAAALRAPSRREVQPDGRVRLWISVRLPDTDEPYMLRVVTLEDGETVHNAFLDRSYRESAP